MLVTWRPNMPILKYTGPGVVHTYSVFAQCICPRPQLVFTGHIWVPTGPCWSSVCPYELSHFSNLQGPYYWFLIGNVLVPTGPMLVATYTILY